MTSNSRKKTLPRYMRGQKKITCFLIALNVNSLDMERTALKNAPYIDADENYIKKALQVKDLGATMKESVDYHAHNKIKKNNAKGSSGYILRTSKTREANIM